VISELSTKNGRLPVSAVLFLRNAGRDAWRWWIGEICDLVPVRVRRTIARMGGDIIVEFGDDVVRVTHGRCSRVSPLKDDAAGATRRLLNAASAFRIFAPRIRLRLPHGQGLTRHIAVPPAARHRLAEIVRLDLAAGVPLAPDDYLAAHYEDTRGVTAVIVKRRFVDEHLSLLKTAGYPAAALDLWDRSGRQALPVNLLPVSPGRQWMSRVTQALLLGAAAILGLSLWLAWSQRGDAIADLDKAIADARKQSDRVMAEAATINGLTEALMALRKRKTVEPSALAYWEETARLLPDTSWLSNLAITGDRIAMTGMSASAPELIGRLERSPYFADVGFSSPVTFDPSAGADRFTISLTLEQAAP
jgi:general secretion pathway protein L